MGFDLTHCLLYRIPVTRTPRNPRGFSIPLLNSSIDVLCTSMATPRHYRGFWGRATGEALYELADFLSWNRGDWVAFERWLDLIERRENKKRQTVKRTSLRARLTRLIHRRAVESKKINGKILVRLSDDGWRAARVKKIQGITASCRNGYCIVTFDIPEKNRHSRNAFRSFLKQSGFEQLQRSVWVHRKDVTTIVAALIDELRIDQWVTVAEGKLVATAFK